MYERLTDTTLLKLINDAHDELVAARVRYLEIHDRYYALIYEKKRRDAETYE